MMPANFNQRFQETPPKPKGFVVSDPVSFPICVCSQLKEIFVVCVTYSLNSTVSRFLFFHLAHEFVKRQQDLHRNSPHLVGLLLRAGNADPLAV